MKKVSLNILKWAALSVLALSSLVLAAAAVVFLRPELLLNDKSLKLAADFARDHQILDARWAKASLKASSHSWRKKRIELEAEGICVRIDATKACASTVRVVLEGALVGMIPKVTVIGPVGLSGGVFQTAVQIGPDLPSAPSAPANPDEPWLPTELPFWLRGVEVRPVALSVDAAEIHDGPYSFNGKIDLRTSGNAKSEPLTVAASAKVGTKRWPIGDGQALSGDATLRLKGDPSLANLALRADAKLLAGARAVGTAFADLKVMAKKLGDLKKASGRVSGVTRIRGWKLSATQRLNARADLDGAATGDFARLKSAIALKLSGQPGTPPQSLTGDLTASLKNPSELEHLQVSFSAVAKDALPEISRIRADSCRIDMRRTDGGHGKIKLECPLLASAPQILGKHCPVDKPVGLKADVRSEIALSQYPPSAASVADAELNVDLRPSIPFVNGGGSIKGKARATLGRLPKGLEGGADADIKLSIVRFEDLVKEFANTSWAVPAPLHILKGRVTLEVQGKADPKQVALNGAVTTRLSSTYQRLNLDGKGALVLTRLFGGSPAAKLGFNLALSDIVLELPRMDIAAPPRLVPEPRFRREAVRLSAIRKEPGMRFDYKFEVSTPAGRPVRLLSNLAKEPVPVQLRLLLASDKPMDGEVRIAKFPLQLFRRPAYLDHFDIFFASPASESKLDGVIKVAYVDYTISIWIFSTLGKPVVQLTSDPPLPEGQLVATLLFGKPLEDLDQDQGNSVGDTRAALANGAVGLASLYALASTPVQSVGYDPTTRAFTAKVRIAEGTSVNVSTDTEQGLGGVGVRKRLGSKWSVTTDLAHPIDERKQVISTFLEWALRY